MTEIRSDPDRLLDYLRKNGPTRARTVMAELGFADQQLLMAEVSLARQGQLEEEDPGGDGGAILKLTETNE